MKYLFILILSFNLYAQNILGQTDRLDLPEFSIFNVKAKIDTGARTSSIQCYEIVPLENNRVKFTLINSKLNKKYFIKPVARIAKVKSSNGESEKRYFINTTIVIYNKAYNIEVSLSFRENMKYSLLVGRELLEQGFIVDVSKKDLSYKSKKMKN